jgi:hypothetical protein
MDGNKGQITISSFFNTAFEITPPPLNFLLPPKKTSELIQTSVQINPQAKGIYYTPPELLSCWALSIAQNSKY